MKTKQERQSGMTLIEIVLAGAVSMILFASVLGIGTESIVLTNFGDNIANLQTQTTRSVSRLSEALGKCGWNSDGVTTYPDINFAGDELSFRVTEDLDGNGYVFDQATGDVEWGAEVYTARLDSGTRVLAVYDSTDTLVLTLGTDIEEVQFSTIVENDTLDPREIRVSVTATKADPKGDLTRNCTGSIFMKN